MSKKDLIECLRQRLASDPRWALRALIRIYQNQTNDEQSKDSDDATAITDASAYFTSQGYWFDEVTASFGEVRPANRFVPALHGRILTVRLTNPSTPQT